MRQIFSYLKNVTAMVWIPYTEADRYKALAASAFEWRKKWESEFEFSFVEHVYRSEDRLAGQHSRRVKVIVIRSKLRYFKKLPEGIAFEIIDDLKPVWGLKAYIRDYSYQSGSQIIHGSRHFKPGQEVYPHKRFSGDGYERAYVTGRHKDTGKFVSLMMPTIRMENWSAAELRDPIVIFKMRGVSGWSSSKNDKEDARHYARGMNERIVRLKAEGKL